VNVRIIAATNVSLEEEVKNKNFREDLFYRLSVIPIELPPLRERKEDIPLLVQHFLKKKSSSERTDPVQIDESAMKMLLRYDWPGNIRELENMVERMVILVDGNLIKISDIPPQINGHKSLNESADLASEILPGETSLKKIVERKEAQYIHHALSQVDGDKKRAAELLEIDLATLYRKIERLGIK